MTQVLSAGEFVDWTNPGQPNIFEPAGNPATPEIQGRLGVRGLDLPESVGALVLAFGDGDEGLQLWITDPAAMGSGGLGLADRHEQIRARHDPARLVGELSLAGAWVWPYEVEGGEFYTAVLVRGPLREDQLGTLVWATGQAALWNTQFTVPVSAEFESGIFSIGRGMAELVSQGRILNPAVSGDRVVYSFLQAA